MRESQGDNTKKARALQSPGQYRDLSNLITAVALRVVSSNNGINVPLSDSAVKLQPFTRGPDSIAGRARTFERSITMATLKVNWIKSTGDDWLSLTLVDLSQVTASGVYMIWYNGNPGKVVRLGQGNIADRLNSHRSNSEITAYSKYGPLYVTWATVPAQYQNGVERYLANEWNPLVGDAFPDVGPISVNSPWG